MKPIIRVKVLGRGGKPLPAGQAYAPRKPKAVTVEPTAEEEEPKEEKKVKAQRATDRKLREERET